jgi:crotonobetainyl-CoA:carnitine CoA-transferase CaiB-like acyl-CoA transferase
MCGFGAALGIGAALFQKSRTGRIGRPRTSLSALSGLAQIPFAHDYIGRRPFDEASGPEAMGSDALNHLYKTADHWIMLAAAEADLPRLARLPGLATLPALEDAARLALLTRSFATAPAADWLALLQGVDVGAALCGSLAAIRAETTRPADGTPGLGRDSYAFSRFADHPSGHGATLLDPCAVRPKLGRVLALQSAEKYGASTRAVLLGLGYAPAEIDALAARGIISESWSREYLPS